MAYDTADILAGARQIRAHLDELVGHEAEAVRERLDELIGQADGDPKTGTRVLALLRLHPAAYEWIRRYLQAAELSYETLRVGWQSRLGEKGFTTLSADELDEPAEAASLAPSPRPPEPPERRYFLAELEDHPAGQPLTMGEQYTIAFGVGQWSAAALAAAAFPDEVLAAADPAIDVFALTVQLNSDDFAILGEATRPLRVPRAGGRSQGKVRFDVMPLHDGDCQLVASVYHDGNFVHQVKLTIPVGGQVQAPVRVKTNGRPPELTAALEPRDISILLEPAPAGGFRCTVSGPVVGWTVLPITATELNAATTAAREAMMAVITTMHQGKPVFQAGLDIPREAEEEALRTLARAGASLFQRLFLHDAAGRDARAVGEWLRDNAMDPGIRLTVQVIADHAPLPWALLYLGDAGKTAMSWSSSAARASPSSAGSSGRSAAASLRSSHSSTRPPHTPTWAKAAHPTRSVGPDTGSA